MNSRPNGTCLVTQPTKSTSPSRMTSIGVCLAVGLALLPSQPSKGGPTDGSSADQWLRGVPKGCRLVALDLDAQDSHKLDPQDRVHVLSKYTIAADQCQTVVLFENICVLAVETQGDHSQLRLTVALTPQQANQLKIANACGTLSVKKTRKDSTHERTPLPEWPVCRIEDRTHAIETGLAARWPDPQALERPTLAARPQTSPGRAHGTITVPLQVDFQR